MRRKQSRISITAMLSGLWEKHSPAIILTSCLAVVVATAVWTRQMPLPPKQQNVGAPTGVPAAGMIQQSITDVSTPSAVPVQTQAPYSMPLAELRFLRGFSEDCMEKNSHTGIWRIHDALDLQADEGDPVYAIANGSISALGEDPYDGCWVEIDHGDFCAFYAGMKKLADEHIGQTVRNGCIIGYVGGGPMDEQDLGPHLHLRTTRGDVAFDPMSLFP